MIMNNIMQYLIAVFGGLALVFGMLASPALAQTPPIATITAGTSQYYSGEDVKFTASLNSSPGHAVVIFVKWQDYDRYWRLQPKFEFSFPCNATNSGSHTITIQTSNNHTDEATHAASADGDAGSPPYPTAYSVGSPDAATATCNVTQ